MSFIIYYFITLKLKFLSYHLRPFFYHLHYLELFYLLLLNIYHDFHFLLSSSFSFVFYPKINNQHNLQNLISFLQHYIFLYSFTFTNFFILFYFETVKFWTQSNKTSNLFSCYFIFKHSYYFFISSCKYSRWMVRRII